MPRLYHGTYGPTPAISSPSTSLILGLLKLLYLYISCSLHNTAATIA
jgi:hypothetical protein